LSSVELCRYKRAFIHTNRNNKRTDTLTQYQLKRDTYLQNPSLPITFGATGIRTNDLFGSWSRSGDADHSAISPADPLAGKRSSLGFYVEEVVRGTANLSPRSSQTFARWRR